MHLRRAAKRVGVLHLVAPAVGLVDRRVLEQPEHVRGRLGLALQRPQRVDLREEARARSLQRLERDRAGDVGGLRQPVGADHAEGAERGHELGAVHERKPFLRLQPDRLEAGLLERLASREPPPFEGGLALADQRQREVGERSEVAARADGAAARHVRQHAAVEALHEQLDRHRARARVALRQRVGAEEHRGAHDLVRVRLADPAGVTAQEAELELFGQLLGNRARDEAAEAGVDAVGVLLAAVRGLLDELAGGAHAPARGVRECDRPGVDGDLPDVGEREIVARQRPALDHAASLSRTRRGAFRRSSLSTVRPASSPRRAYRRRARVSVTEA